MAQNRLFKRSELRPGLKSDLIKRRACIAISGQRLGMTTAAIQRQHQKPARTLPQRISRDQTGDCPDHLTVLPARQPGLDQPLDRDRTKLLESIRLTTCELEL